MSEKLVLHIIYGYDHKDTKLEDREVIFKTHSYQEVSDLFNALINLQFIEDVATIGYTPKDGYAIIHSCLDEIETRFGVKNVLGYFKFKHETYLIC